MQHAPITHARDAAASETILRAATALGLVRDVGIPRARRVAWLRPPAGRRQAPAPGSASPSAKSVNPSKSLAGDAAGRRHTS